MNDAWTGSGSFQPTAALFKKVESNSGHKTIPGVSECLQAWCSHLCKLFSVIALPLSPLSSPLAALFTHLCSVFLLYFALLPVHSCFSPTQTLFCSTQKPYSPLLSAPSLKKKKKKESLQAGIAAPITLTSFSSQVFPGGHFFFHSVASEICNPSLATTPIIEPFTLCRPGNCQKTFTYRLLKPNRKQLELLLPVFMEGGLTENSPAEPVFSLPGSGSCPLRGGNKACLHCRTKTYRIRMSQSKLYTARSWTRKHVILWKLRSLRGAACI